MKMAEAGHNSGMSSDRLKSIFNRIVTLENDKRDVAEDIKEVYSEAKGLGYDVKVLRKVVAAQRIELEKRREQFELFDLYASAIGMEI
jgi:uncharacterized protein (UPF0335 family)